MARGAHKVNPVGFRIGVNKNWKSRWYASKADYADRLHDDIKIRNIIDAKLKAAGIAEIIIKRVVSKVTVEVFVARPGVVIGRGGEAINNLKQHLSRQLGYDVEVNVYETKNPEIIAKLVAENIALMCEKRMAPKTAASKIIESAMGTGLIKGITIWIGGRIRGAEIARVEKYGKGYVPRHTLRADIDYAFAEAQVPGSGKHGIKVWINKGEKSTYSID